MSVSLHPSADSVESPFLSSTTTETPADGTTTIPVAPAADALLGNYKRAPGHFVGGEGVYLVDSDGKRYLDFVSGIAVNALGYADAGLRQAMHAALEDAGLAPAAVDYINLHGTGTPSNDSAESKAVEAVFGSAVPCSSTKGASGHTLGAAGALEIAICALAVSEGFMPAGLHCSTLDPSCRINYLRTNDIAAPRVALSNSLGFGGTNCSVVLGRLA